MTARGDLLHDLAVADDLADDRLIRRARSRFLAASLGVGLVLAVVAYLVAETMTERSARDDARGRAQIVAAVVGASIRAADDHVGGGELSAAVNAVAAAQAVNQVVVWRADGEVAWAHDKTLVGRTFELHDELRRLFARDGFLVGRLGPVDLEGADLPVGAEGNYEVFASTRGAGGEPLVVESYVVRSSIAEHQREALWTLLPLAAGALLVFEATFLGLGMLMIRQVRRGRQSRIRLTMAALRSVDQERRELAHELHDGIVQDLAATRYALAGISQGLPAGTRRTRGPSWSASRRCCATSSSTYGACSGTC